jgi:16S rRNA C967 or C1407 C5-methylase (RsmB/RsmF family)
MENMGLNEFLIEHLNKQYGETLAEEIVEGYKCQRYTTLRINTLLTTKMEVLSVLDSLDIKYEEVPLFHDALVILNKNSKEMLELEICKSGKIYLQSLSSQLPALLLYPKEKCDILDMCASPGSKTTYLAQLVNNNAFITACEIDKIRMERLKFNVNKLGATCVNFICTDSRKLDDYFRFDQILLDAPCSGSGTLSVHDKSMMKFSKALVYNSSKLQTELLKKALTILKPGQEMIYSTCSILDIENENVVNNVLKSMKCSVIPFSEDVRNLLPLLPTTIEGSLCIKPNQYFEGFYVVKLKKA